MRQVYFTIFLISYFFLSGCEKFRLAEKTINGHALVFKDGSIRLYPNLERDAVVSVNADRAIWPTVFMDTFDKGRGECLIFLYKLKLHGHFDERGFMVSRFIKVRGVNKTERDQVIRKLGVDALDDSRTCASIDAL